ncbi:AAA family ATPase [Streptomyces sp. IpFD-1.1]|uniref:ATP-dependent nuclease n=1 Tax=Streptomyces sp. IpFD-1.1 TaxID=2841664 RepID=UPI002095114E|nr:AAA family ATPase [Streptomyces sp. IpFD-1.1]MCO6751703.1 AAA family ATPase [Streptomyces sp. IpFD-1.1]
MAWVMMNAVVLIDLWGDMVHLSRIAVSGFRASAEGAMACDLPGRFSALIGANGAGKTTLTDALYLAHPTSRFPVLPRYGSAALAPERSTRAIEVAYELGDSLDEEGHLGRRLHQVDHRPLGQVAQSWDVRLDRRLGGVVPKVVSAHGRTLDLDPYKLIYLPAWRHPLDELARREARILVELLRAEQQRLNGTRNLVGLRARASQLLEELAKESIIDAVEKRIGGYLTDLSAGVDRQWSYIRGQVIDDTYLARVLEVMLAVMEGRRFARPLEVSGLGYVNLLHIAVTLAAIPDSAEAPRGDAWPPPDAHDRPPLTEEEQIQQATLNLEQAQADADAEEDSFFGMKPFHATVVIVEPEAHLHPQLQHALARYLRRTVKKRPELQIILSTHAPDVITACAPEELVVVRRTARGRVCRAVADVVPEKDRAVTLRKTRLHLDASRSAALFAERLVLVEGVTDAAVVREFGRTWAGADARKHSFIDALSIVHMGWKVGQWPVHLLATQGRELCTRLAVLVDSDLPFESEDRKKPKWLSAHDPSVVDAFVSHPTLEPAITEGNKHLIEAALEEVGLEVPEVTPQSVHELFRSARTAKGEQPAIPAGLGAKKKGDFALAFAGLLAEANEVDPEQASNLPTVPEHMRQLFEFLYTPDATAEGDFGSENDPLAPLDEPDWLAVVKEERERDSHPAEDIADFLWPDDEEKEDGDWADEYAPEPDAPPWEELLLQRPPRRGAWPTAAPRTTTFDE